MKITKAELSGPALISVRKFTDDRGFFTERFRVDQWRQNFPDHSGFIQDNYSWSKYGVLRGLHFQFNPDQGKLVTCVEGAITDVIVDIRKSSPTFGHHLTFNLSAAEPQWLWVPPGFAHGFVVTSPNGAGVMYKVDAPYSPATEGAIRWNDSDLNISWPIKDPVLSPKDAAAPSFKDYVSKPTHS